MIKKNSNTIDDDDDDNNNKSINKNIIDRFDMLLLMAFHVMPTTGGRGKGSASGNFL